MSTYKAGQLSEWPKPPGWEALPSSTALHKVLAAGKSHKAPGPDGIPAELGKLFPAEVVDFLYPLLLKFSFRGAEALGHKAGQAILFYKGRGSKSECSAYRAILLLCSWAKAQHQASGPASAGPALLPVDIARAAAQ